MRNVLLILTIAIGMALATTAITYVLDMTSNPAKTVELMKD